VIIEVFAARRQPVDALSQQLPHRVVHKHLLPLVLKVLDSIPNRAVKYAG
jgi:hypothetical protein